MAAEKKGFVLYFDACKELESLEPEQRGWVLTAAYRFALACAEQETEAAVVLNSIHQLTPEARMACRFLCDTIQRDTGKWHTRREHLSRAAREREERRGGREIAEMRRYAQELRQNRAGGSPGEAWDYVE